jgi:hypothetical protein
VWERGGGWAAANEEAGVGMCAPIQITGSSKNISQMYSPLWMSATKWEIGNLGMGNRNFVLMSLCTSIIHTSQIAGWCARCTQQLSDNETQPCTCIDEISDSQMHKASPSENGPCQ